MEIIKNRWGANQNEINRLWSLPKKELMKIIQGFKLGTGTLSRKRLEKDAYNAIKATAKPKKVHSTRTSKRSKSDNTEG